MILSGVLAHKAITDVTRRKGRTALVILGILIGVLGLTAVNVADDVMGNAFAFRYANRTWPDLAYVVQGQAINASLLPGVRQTTNVLQTGLRTEYNTRWHINSGSGSVPLALLGNSATSSDALGTFQLTSGRLPGAGEVVMESSDSAIQAFALGDRITVESPGGTTSLRIVGLARTPGDASQQGALAYMHPDVLQRLAHLNGSNDLLVKLRVVNEQTLQQANQTIAQYLHNHGLQRFVVGAQVIADPNRTIVSGVLNAIRAVSLIALLLACFLLINTVSTLITEQMRIIGTMKALGGQRGKIIQSYLISVSIYASAGTVLGIVLGIVGGYLLAQNFAAAVALNLGPFTLAPWIIVVSMVAGLALPLLSALIPLMRGTSITVHQAMAAYGVQSHGRRIHTTGSSFTWMPQTVWLGLRSTFRKPVRATLTLLALTLSGAVFLSVQVATTSIGATLDELAHTYNSDVNISLRPLPYQQVHDLLSRVPNVQRIEPRLTQTVQVPQAQGKLDLIGLQPGTQLYQYHLVTGRWLAANESNTIVLSDVVARDLGLQVGNELTFVANQNQVENWQIVGIVHDLNKDVGSQAIGVAYTNIEGLNALDNMPLSQTSDLMIRAQNRSPVAVDKLAKDLAATLTQNGFVPSVTTLQQQIQQNQGPAQIVYAVFDLVAVIVALVGILGLFSTLSSSVLERRLEIGILRSLGASGLRVAGVFWVEGLAFAGLAWQIGAVLGVPGAYGLVAMLSQQLVPLEFIFSPLLILSTLLLILLLVALASVGPALTASRLRLRDLLRYE